MGAARQRIRDVAILMDGGRSARCSSAPERIRRTALTTLLVLAGGLAAVPALARPSPRPDAPSLRQLATDVTSEDSRVRRKALNALAAIGPEALDPLSLLVADPVRGIRRDAILAVLAIYVQPPSGSRVESAEDAFGWAPYRATPWPPPPVLIANLVSALGDEWSLVRRDAVYALGIVKAPPIDEGLAKELIYSLSDPADDVRLAAVRVCGRLRVTQAGEALIGHIGDPVLVVRLAAMRALGDIREERALVALRQQLDYYYGGSAGRAALHGLARIAHPSTATLFEQERLSSDSVHRLYAYEAAARLGGIPLADVEKTETLLTEERDKQVVVAMAFALAAAGRPYVDRIVQALADRETAGQALEYLVDLGRSQPDAIVPYLQHADPGVRAYVAMAAGFVGGSAIEAALTRAAGDSDPAVRHAADVALMRLRALETRGARR